jgi:acetyl esterase/lipase
MANDVRVGLESAFGVVQPHSTENAPPRPAPIVLTDIAIGIACPAVEQKSAVYSSPLGNPLSLDLYMPPASRIPAPAVVMIHGGAWRAGNRTELPRINQYLSSRGYLVASVDYRLAPDCKFPAAKEDVRAAVAYLKEKADTLNLDPRRIALIGRSAGGHLALLDAYAANDPSIRGVVAIYAPADLVWGYEHPSNPGVLNSTVVLEDFLGGSLGRIPRAYHDCSPINFITAASPPTLLIHGERDDIVYIHNSEQIAQRLRESGVPHYFLRIPWGNHGCDANLNGPGGQLSVYAIERFLAAVFK